MNAFSKNIIKRLLPQCGMLFCTLLAFLLYDIFCGCETDWIGYLFTRWSTWNYLLFFSLLFSMPAMVWNLRKTQAVIITILSIWLWASILYFRQFQTSIPLGSYGQLFAVTHNYGNSITSLMRVRDLFFLVPMVGAWVLSTKKETGYKTLKTVYWFALVITFIFSWGVSLARYGFEGTFRGVHHAGYTVRSAQFTPAGMLVHDIISHLLPISRSDSQKVTDWIAKHNEFFKTTLIKSQTRDKVIVILVESLDNWAVTAQVEGQPVMPTLNKLTTDSSTLYVPNVVCQTKDGHSSDGQFIIFSGILPLQTGAVALDHPASAKYSLAKAFSNKYGVAPVYFDCSPKEIWNTEFTIPMLGFKNILFKEDYPNQLNDGNQKYIRDGRLMAYAIQRMQRDSIFSADTPWFLELVTASSHSDYMLPPGEKTSLQLKGEYPKRLADYLKIMRYVDESIAELLEYIKSRNDCPNISVVITGDHFAPSLSNYNAPFKDDRTLVPFFVLNSPFSGRIDKYMGQVDIYPTLIDLFCPEYPHHGLGISILSPLHPGMAVGSDGKVYGNGSPDVVKHLRDAFEVSDIILRYDLLKK